MKNIDLIFKDSLTFKEKKRLAVAYTSHILTSIKEILRMNLSRKYQLRQRIDIRGAHNLINALEKGNGAFLLTGHLGNWEFTAPLSLSSIDDYPGKFHVVRKPLKPRFVEKILFKHFRKNRINIIYKDAAIRGIKAALKSNEAVLFTMDQRVPLESRSGVEVDFLGVKTNAYKTMASLVQRWGTPVIPCITYRSDNGHHIVEFYPELAWKEHPDRNTAISENTRIYSKVIEKFIVQHPEQWIWSYNRWSIPKYK